MTEKKGVDKEIGELTARINFLEAEMKTLSAMGAISEAKEIADAVVYLTEARNITGEVLHVDGGMHIGKW